MQSDERADPGEDERTSQDPEHTNQDAAGAIRQRDAHGCINGYRNLRPGQPMNLGDRDDLRKRPIARLDVRAGHRS